MSNGFEQFKALHTEEEPLLLGNVWDVQSAKVFEGLQVKAIATSSAAVAATLGYSDGEDMPFEEYYYIVKRIKSVTGNTPLTVDLEAGYGKTEDAIVDNLQRLYDLGVAGINIEDSIVNGGDRTIVAADGFAKKLAYITNRMEQLGIRVFINVRCDAFLLGFPNALQEALNRIAAYENTGAHGIFLPCITAAADIKAVVNATHLPLNVMCMPNLPDFTVLQSLGVKRISMGNFLHGTLYKKMEGLTQDIIGEGNFSVLFQ